MLREPPSGFPGAQAGRALRWFVQQEPVLLRELMSSAFCLGQGLGVVTQQLPHWAHAGEAIGLCGRKHLKCPWEESGLLRSPAYPSSSD